MSSRQEEVSAFFLDFSRRKLLEQYWPRLRQAVETLTDEQVWWRPNEACNSVGNLLLHLNGNVYQWLVASFKREEDRRDRPAEFHQRAAIPAGELLARLGATMDQASAVLSRLSASELAAQYEIQGYRVSGLEAVYQVVEHSGLHYGQILYIVKMLTGTDLGFYRNLNATGRAS